jgi:phosphatidylinositol 4-kinase
VDIFRKQDISQQENNLLQFESLEQIDEEDYNLTSFLSNVNFIDKLSNICEIMRIAPPENQMEILYKEINSINKLLPSNLYIPFLSNTIRNYIIVHIPVSETRIFRTKNRAPYMLTVELIRIDELIL